MDLPGQLEKLLQAPREEAGADLQCKGKVRSRLQVKPYPALTAQEEGGNWQQAPGKSPPFTPGIPEERFLPSPWSQHTNIYRDTTSKKQSLTPLLRAGAPAPARESDSLNSHQERGLKGWESSRSVKLLLDGGAA